MQCILDFNNAVNRIECNERAKVNAYAENHSGKSSPVLLWEIWLSAVSVMVVISEIVRRGFALKHALVHLNSRTNYRHTDDDTDSDRDQAAWLRLKKENKQKY